jgi:hypothetical protein
MMFKILPCVVGGCLPYSSNMGNILNINSVKILVALSPRRYCRRHHTAAAAKLLLLPPPPRQDGTAVLPSLPLPPRTNYHNCHHAATTAAALPLQPICCCPRHHRAELAPQHFCHCRCRHGQATATATALPPLPPCCCHRQTSTLACAPIFIDTDNLSLPSHDTI